MRLRENILDVLDLWTSKDKQLDYQDRVPIAQVSAELFCMWDDFYDPDRKYLKSAFNDEEIEILADFDKLLNHISEKMQKNVPDIKDFVGTNDWLVLNQAAIHTLKKIKNPSAKAM